MGLCLSRFPAQIGASGLGEVFKDYVLDGLFGAGAFHNHLLAPPKTRSETRVAQRQGEFRFYLRASILSQSNIAANLFIRSLDRRFLGGLVASLFSTLSI